MKKKLHGFPRAEGFKIHELDLSYLDEIKNIKYKKGYDRIPNDIRDIILGKQFDLVRGDIVQLFEIVVIFDGHNFLNTAVANIRLHQKFKVLEYGVPMNYWGFGTVVWIGGSIRC